MKQLVLKFILFYLVTIPLTSTAEPAKAIVHGENHLFKVDIIDNWILDSEFAMQQQLGAFFYPKGASDISETYIYAHGWEKPTKDSTLQEFIDSNFAEIKQNFPAVTFKKTKQGASGSILDAWMYSYSNMGKRFKEEVIYLESDTTVITLVFSTMTESNYKKYVGDFDKLASSFVYLSSDSEEIKQSFKNITSH